MKSNRIARYVAAVALLASGSSSQVPPSAGEHFSRKPSSPRQYWPEPYLERRTAWMNLYTFLCLLFSVCRVQPVRLLRLKRDLAHPVSASRTSMATRVRRQHDAGITFSSRCARHRHAERALYRLPVGVQAESPALIPILNAYPVAGKTTMFVRANIDEAVSIAPASPCGRRWIPASVVKHIP